MYPYGYNGYNKYNKNNKNLYTGKKSKAKIIIIVAIIIVLAFVAAFFIYNISVANKKNARIVSSRGDIKDIDIIDSDSGDIDIKNEIEELEYDLGPRMLPDPVAAKGVYISGWTAGNNEKLNRFIELCETTDINSLIIDIKNDEGQITFLSYMSRNSMAATSIIKNPGEIVSLLKSHEIYTIARIVCFKDPIRSIETPEFAIKDKDGNLWKDTNGNTWLNPYETGAWDYLIEVAKEAAELGFDEIQFDYVRFPTDGNILNIDYGDIIHEKSKTEAIGEFLKYARRKLWNDKVYISADVFGIIAVSQSDGAIIGQDLWTMAQYVDYLCPMIYPSHYANKRQNGQGQVINGILFEAPDMKPYEVIYNTMLLIKASLSDLKSCAVIRPYLQDFTAAYLGSGYYQTYSAKQVREQIQATYDAGFEEWIMWNASNIYTDSAFK